jgi:hypothetical protein
MRMHVLFIESGEIVFAQAYPGKWFGFTGMGCVREACSPGISEAGNGFSSIGNNGFPVSRSIRNISCFANLCHRICLLPLCTTVTRFGGQGKVFIPYIMMNNLIVPHPFALSQR